MPITKTQGLSMASIVLIGLLAGGAVLMTERHGAGEAGEDGHGHGTAAAKTEGHADDAHGKAGHADDDHDEDHDNLAVAASASTVHAEEKGHEHGHEKDADKAHGGHDDHDEAEGLLKLDAAQLQAAGITLQAAGPGSLKASAPFTGEIRFNDDRTAHVVPRLAGVAEAVPATLGQQVQAGQVLAVVASTVLAEQRSELLTARKRRELAQVTFEREKKLWQDKISAEQDYLQAQAALQEADIAVQAASQKLAAVGATAHGGGGLNRFEVRAPFAGTVVEKHLSLGEAVKEDASIFTISDLRTVWAEFAVAAQDLPAVRVGQTALVSSTAFEGQVQGKVSYVGALLGEQTRTARARVTLENPQGAWRPGLYVTVAVLGEARQVPLAIPAEAVQQVEGRPTVFVQAEGQGEHGLQARAVTLGRSDGRMVEVTAGLKAGERYAATNTFTLKSELGKASAEHSH